MFASEATKPKRKWMRTWAGWWPTASWPQLVPLRRDWWLLSGTGFKFPTGADARQSGTRGESQSFTQPTVGAAAGIARTPSNSCLLQHRKGNFFAFSHAVCHYEHSFCSRGIGLQSCITGEEYLMLFYGSSSAFRRKVFSWVMPGVAVKIAALCLCADGCQEVTESPEGFSLQCEQIFDSCLEM